MSDSAVPHPTPTKSRGVRRWLPYLAPAILVVVALNQIVLTRTTRLNPWKGGGFGMFSTAERRAVKLFLVRAEDERRIALPRGYAVGRVSNFPTEKNLRALAKSLFDRSGRRWPNARAIRVEVWRTEFSSDTTQIEHQPFYQLTYEFPDRTP